MRKEVTPQNETKSPLEKVTAAGKAVKAAGKKITSYFRRKSTEPTTSSTPADNSQGTPTPELSESRTESQPANSATDTSPTTEPEAQPETPPTNRNNYVTSERNDDFTTVLHLVDELSSLGEVNSSENKAGSSEDKAGSSEDELSSLGEVNSSENKAGSSENKVNPPENEVNPPENNVSPSENEVSSDDSNAKLTNKKPLIIKAAIAHLFTLALIVPGILMLPPVAVINAPLAISIATFITGVLSLIAVATFTTIAFNNIKAENNEANVKKMVSSTTSDKFTGSNSQVPVPPADGNNAADVPPTNGM